MRIPRSLLVRLALVSAVAKCVLMSVVATHFGCRSSSDCPVISQSDLLGQVELLRLEVYSASGGARCDGARLAKETTAPLERSAAGAPGEALDIELSPGDHILYLTAYRDVGAILVGSACREVTVSDGESACFALDLVQAAGNVICRIDSDCSPGFRCSPSGSCVEACVEGECAIADCAAGFLDCDHLPSTGCECAGRDRNDGQKGCCGNLCQTAHQDGFGHPYYDCQALGSYSLALAKEAADAYGFGTSVDEQAVTCGVRMTTKALCVTEGRSCVCWAYEDSGTTQATGHARYHKANGNSEPCVCPSSSDPPWN